MKKLGKKVQPNIVEPNEEQRAFLPSSSEANRCSSLGFKEPSIEQLINTLSEIIIDAYVFSKQTKTRNK